MRSENATAFRSALEPDVDGAVGDEHLVAVIEIRDDRAVSRVCRGLVHREPVRLLEVPAPRGRVRRLDSEVEGAVVGVSVGD